MTGVFHRSAALFGLVLGLVAPAGAQLDVRGPGVAAYPWSSDQIVGVAGAQNIRIQVSLPPEGTTRPAGGFPVLYYTGKAPAALMTDSMRRMGDDVTHAILVGANMVSVDGRDMGGVTAHLMRDVVRAEMTRRFPTGFGREHYLAIGSGQSPDDIAAKVGSEAFDTYMVADLDCPVSGRSSASRRVDADLLIIRRADCAGDDGVRAEAWRRVHRIDLADQDAVTMVPEAMIIAITLALADTFEAGVDR